MQVSGVRRRIGGIGIFALGVACGGAGAPEATSPVKETASLPQTLSDAADEQKTTEIQGKHFSVTVPYEASHEEGNGYADVHLLGDGHRAICRVFEEPPDSFRGALAEGVTPWPSEQTFRRGVELEESGGHPVAHLSLMKISGKPDEILSKLDSQSQAELDAYEATALSFSLSTEHFILCRPESPENTLWFRKAATAFFKGITFSGAESKPLRTTITSRSDPSVKVRSKIYGFKWWVRQQSEEGMIDQSFSFGFWGHLGSAVVGRSVELTDKAGKVARVAYFSGLGGDMKADSALQLLKDGRYAYALGSAATEFFVKGKLSSPLDTEKELVERMRKPGAYSFTEQKYMPYMSQSRAIPVTYSRGAKDAVDAVRISAEGADSESLLDPTGRPLSTHRAAKTGEDEYRRIFDSAGHVAQGR